LRWPTGTDVTAIRSRANTYSRFYLGIQKARERTVGCAATLYVGCHYQLAAGDTYDADEHSLTFATVGFLGPTNILPGMTLACGTADDPFYYGSARIRYVDNAADILYLEPNNLFAEGWLVPGNYIYIDGIYRLYRKLPYIMAGVTYEDGNPDTVLAAAGIPGYGIAFSTNYLDRPCAKMGSPRFAWTNEPIPFYGWRSHGRGGNTINAYSWDFDDGSPPIAQAGTPAAPVWATWHEAGEYTVRLTVTDNSLKVGNDAYGVPFTRHVAVRPVLVYDRPGQGSHTPYTRFAVRNLRGSYGSGWTASIEVFGTADKEEFPDNALVIVFCEDWYNGVEGSRGGWYGQEGILFCGYILADSVQVDSETSTVTFEAATIEQWMKDIFCWPGNFEANGAPAKWKQFVNMTCEDVLWYLAEFRSNLKDVTDCFFASDVNAQKQVDFIDITEADLYDQMSEQVGSCFFGQLSASRVGSVHLFKHKNMLDLSERVWWGPPIWVFDKQDWRDELEIGDEKMRDSIAQIDFIGFIYDVNGNPQEVYSLAPERQTNFGKVEKVTGVLLTGATIAAAQAESNTLAGLYRAWKNTRFGHIRVPAFNNRFLEPATLDYFGVTLAAGDTYRGYEWAAKEWLCTEVNYAIDNEKGIILADITGEASTWGPDGVAGDYPHGDPSEDPPDEPPEYWPEIPDDPPPWWPAITCAWAEAGLGVATAASGFWITTNLNDSPPTWTALNGGLAGNWLNMRDADAVVDSDGNVTVYAATQAGIAKLSSCAGPWTQLILPDPTNSAGDMPAPTAADLDWGAVKINPADHNTVHVIGYITDIDGALWRCWQYVSNDGGVTWTSYQFRDGDIIPGPVGCGGILAGLSQWCVTLHNTGPDVLHISADGKTIWVAVKIAFCNC